MERRSGVQPMDSILDTISNVPAATSNQELSWQLTTVHKLDCLDSSDVSTEPRQDSMVDEILDVLHHLQSPANQGLPAKLAEITSMAIKLWSVLRKDSCRVQFDYDPSTGDWQKWEFVDDVATDGSMAANSPNKMPADRLPPNSFMLFPRITGFFDSTSPKPLILHRGLELPKDSPAFQTSLEEIEHINHATKIFKRSIRSGSMAQSSPVIGKR